MQHEFWHQRWQENQIGFHSPDFNPQLERFWPSLRLAPNSRVFVPLCGKSKDMLWLLAQDFQVTGVELSPLAVEAFFAENHLHPTLRQHGEFLIREINGLQIYCGDFFGLSMQDAGQIEAVYDRAALVALPAEMRLDYATKLSALLQPGAQILLVAFAYPQHEMPGPPFSVQEDEVDLLFHSFCNIELLTSEDLLQRELRFKQRGVSSMLEQVYRLSVR